MSRPAAPPASAFGVRGGVLDPGRLPVFFSALFLVLLASRLCHMGVLWEPGELPLAAAIQMLHGKTLYREIWYDKPPLAAAVCLLWGARAGLPLALAGALYALTACALAYRFARELWSETEGRAAAAMLAFFLVFDFPVSVMALGPDLLMLAPHLGAVYLAWKGRPFWSGAAAGVAFLVNSKALFVLVACALWQSRALPQLLAGFALPAAVAGAWLATSDALGAYWEQVWRQGFLYARSTFLEHPLKEAALRTANWAGFHTALVLGAAWWWARGRGKERVRLAAWAALSLAAVASGWRFFPRYYLQLLPPLALACAAGIGGAIGNRRLLRLAFALALIVPAARFGPRYALLARDILQGRDSEWADTAMDRDSRAAARLVSSLAGSGDTLFVWGYRPDVYVYTRLPAASRFLESQPLTGVFADRHLTQSASVAPQWAARNRRELLESRPEFLLDGLGTFNPDLAPAVLPDLREWLSAYEPAGRTRFTLVYRRRHEAPH